MIFTKEKDFEDALIKVLFSKGWETDVLKYPTEEDLIKSVVEKCFKKTR